MKSLQPEFNKGIFSLLCFNLVIQYPVFLVSSVFPEKSDSARELVSVHKRDLRSQHKGSRKEQTRGDNLLCRHWISSNTYINSLLLPGLFLVSPCYVPNCYFQGFFYDVRWVNDISIDHKARHTLGRGYLGIDRLIPFEFSLYNCIQRPAARHCSQPTNVWHHGDYIHSSCAFWDVARTA